MSVETRLVTADEFEAFIAGQDRQPVEQGPVPQMSDLAVEVQSPGQSDKHMADKAAYSLANGTRMVWLVYPRKGLVEVLTTDERHLLTGGDRIDGGEVLPGFTLRMDDSFAA